MFAAVGVREWHARRTVAPPIPRLAKGEKSVTRRLLIVLVGVLTLASIVGLAGTRAAERGALAVPQAVVGPHLKNHTGDTAPSSSDCMAALQSIGGTCYSPQDIRNEYDITPLLDSGVDGSGQTIVIFDAFGSPTIQADLKTFDAAYGLPNPPSFKVYAPEGKPQYPYLGAPTSAVNNKNFQTQIGWAYETTLDVEWAHALAPGANIALVVTPTAETQGVQGIPNLQNAAEWAFDNHIGTIWSNSWATTEQAFHTPASIQQLDTFYARAATAGVSAFFGTDDTGVANTDKQGRAYSFPTVTYPSSSPNVISVGGTQIQVAPQITTYLPEAVWNDCCGAAGGGYSTVFGEPSWQKSAGISSPTGMRGMPDVSLNAALVSNVLIWETFDPAGSGWTFIGGVSSATPQWAAIDALANQADGALGFLAPRLYQIYADPTAYASAFHDITAGNNSFAGVNGYSAAPGWDPASGLGTPDVANLVAALANTSP
jgi:subtilase family serine protease